MSKPTDAEYARIARSLAETLIRYAFDPRTDEQKGIVALHNTLCDMRRRELMFEADNGVIP